MTEVSTEELGGILRELIEGDTDFTAEETWELFDPPMPMLHKLASDGSVALVTQLLDHYRKQGRSIAHGDEKGHYPLLHACNARGGEGSLGVVQLLLKHTQPFDVTDTALTQGPGSVENLLKLPGTDLAVMVQQVSKFGVQNEGSGAHLPIPALESLYPSLTRFVSIFGSGGHAHAHLPRHGGEGGVAG